MPTGIPKNGINKGWFKKRHKVSKKIRKKMGLANKGHLAWNKGKRLPKSTCEKLRQISLNMPQSQRNNIRKAIKKLWKNPTYRKRMSDAHKTGRNKYHNGEGYMWIYNPKHPYTTKSGYMLEHRLIMERMLGRYLFKEERVHHINGIKDDNRIKNLQLFKNENEHVKFHYSHNSKPYGAFAQNKFKHH